MEKAINILKAVGNKTRLRIMKILLEAGQELCICEIMDSLRLAQYNISKHIKELKLAGLVTEREEGRFVFYSLLPQKGKSYHLILESIRSMTDKALSEDKKRVMKRLALRVDGKCVVGMKKCYKT